MRLFQRKPNKVQPIELSDQHRRARLILICILIVIAAAAFTAGLMSYLNGDSGWRMIEVSSDKVNCGEDFVFNYYFAQTGGSASAVNKQIISLYTEAAEKTYWLFNADESSSDRNNLGYLNQHPNEAVTVDPVLYDALALLESSGSRHHYLAGIYTEYDNLFFSESDPEAAGRDPEMNADVAAYVSQITAFANDPAHISLELLGGNQVRLTVSDEYLTFVQENEIGGFLDLHWMKNAFIIDYFADVMTQAGYTGGYIASYDGFTRNLFAGSESFSFNVFDRVENSIYLAARMEYSQPTSIVYLRNYPMGQSDRWHYYTYDSGRIATSYIDPADGLCKSAANNLVCYASGQGCAEILMQMLPVYITEELDEAALQSMAAQQIYSIWCKDTVICYNDPSLQLQDLHEGDGLKYTQALVK